MNNRCYNKKAPNYSSYGGRGLSVFEGWKNNPRAFIDYVETLPKAKNINLTLDRIKNDRNYEPRNLRWATKHVQQANQGVSSDNTSGYRGVYFEKSSNKWLAYINVNLKRIRIGLYFSSIEAIIARNDYIIKYNLTEYHIQEP